MYETGYTKVMDKFDYVNVWTWPMWARRLFLLLLPISFPLWIGSILVAFCVFVIVLICMLIVDFIYQFWTDKNLF